VRFELSAEHSHFAWVAVDRSLSEEALRPALIGGARTVAIEVSRTAEAFDFAIEASVDEPKRGDIALAGSRLWWRGGAQRWSSPVEGQSGPPPEALAATARAGVPRRLPDPDGLPVRAWHSLARPVAGTAAAAWGELSRATWLWPERFG
jgi:hypothetical protein